MKNRIITAILCSSMIITALTGCGSGTTESSAQSSAAPDSSTTQSSSESSSAATPSAEAVTVEFFQQKMEEGPQRGYQEVIQRFHAEYPEINIEINTVPDAGKVLVSRISSNDIPPIFSDYPTQMQFKQKVENGFIEKISGQEFLSRVNPPALEMSKANDGEVYALPYSHNFMGVYYNIDIFAANNIEVPTTYAELISACEALKTAGVNPLVLTYKDPGRVGHMFQSMTVAWTQGGVEKLLAVAKDGASIIGDAELTGMSDKLLELTSYANEDAFGLADTGMWEQFANGEYAMCITGSYARGTIKIANPDINMGVFPLPNDTKETTTLLTGIDAAICISASASQQEKDAGLKFLEFLSRGENAQIWCDNDGAPSTITEVIYKDEGVQPVIDKMQSGPIHDWMASTIDNNIVTDMYNVTQEFLINRNTADYIAALEDSIKTNAQ